MADDRRPDRVQLEGALGLTAGRLVGVGVLVGDEALAVEGDAARVPALAGRGLQTLA